MTYERLMEHAEDIRREAVAVTMAMVGGDPRRRAGVEREFADVPDAFRVLTGFPDPERIGVDEMDDVLCGLSMGDSADLAVPANPELARIAAVNAALDKWVGPAGERVRRGFVEPWPAFVRNQFAVGVVLRSALLAHREIWARARQDADQIAEQGLAAVGACPDCTRTEWTVTFTVVSSVAAVVAVPLGGVAALAAGVSRGCRRWWRPPGPVRGRGPRSGPTIPARWSSGCGRRSGSLRGHIREQRATVAGTLRQAGQLMADRPELFGWRR
ncbi:hypothetical protein [Dactylosporangium darangshiense]|uniref:hypothetical protein n=1 Tax=Dactylosporangium darangshiense TaxID=579108 RepID=UPI003625165E